MSVITASTDVAQPGEFIIMVRTIGCSAYGFQRCTKSA
jgi:hypothetical protein